MPHIASPFGARSTIALGLWLAAATAASAQTMAPAPEAATGRTAKTLGTAQRYMAAAANPLAAAAGREMLRAGGSATDAAIAIQLVLNLVEPQSSGIGGGAFFVHWDEAGRRMTTLDGRE
ncbi:MAG: gamma-glutamyltransferase, partial [Hyphomicrobiales bacterium]